MTSAHKKPYERHRLQIEFTEPSMTQQSHKDSVDINKIIARYDRTGVLPPSRANPMYGDVTAFAKPFQEALDASGITIDQARDFANNWSPPSSDAAATTPDEEKKKEGGD